jgi:hypothetical protein
MAQIKDEILGQNLCNLTDAKTTDSLRRSFASFSTEASCDKVQLLLSAVVFAVVIKCEGLSQPYEATSSANTGSSAAVVAVLTAAVAVDDSCCDGNESCCGFDDGCCSLNTTLVFEKIISAAVTTDVANVTTAVVAAAAAELLLLLLSRCFDLPNCCLN